MGLFGFDSVSDMFDGGGAGGSGAKSSTGSHADYVSNNPNDTTAQASTNSGGSFVGNTLGISSQPSSMTIASGQTLSSIAAANGTTVAALMAANPNITDPNKISAGASLNIPGGSSESKIKGVAPTNFLQKVSPLGIIGKLSGWANNLDPTKDITGGAAAIVGGRQVYDNGKMQYSYNFLGLPYEVKIIDGAVVDKLSIKYDKDGKPDPNGMTGYERMAQEARDSGDNDRADQIMQEASDNAADPATGGGAANPLDTNGILEMAKAAGVVQSNEEIAAMLADPKKYLADRGINMSDLVDGTLIDPNAEGTSLDATNPNYELGDSPAYTATTVDQTATIDPITQGPITTYDANTATDRMSGDAYTVDGKTGEIKDRNLVDAEQIDIKGAATGVNADGSTSVVGEALSDFAFQDISRIIDTSTIAGKLLAEKLGQGNYTDAKSTILGQMKIISDEFKDSNNNPKIPAWAQSLSRETQRTMAFSGVTGTAAIAAMSNAIMEATLGVADKEAAFFQTLTIKNLDNRQQSIINKANVIAQFEVSNLDARQAAAVQNAKTFLQMDLQNLTNLQQAEVINSQAMVDALFNDQAAINASRIFSASASNDFQKYYDNILFQTMSQNTEMVNSMEKFNAGEKNNEASFNASLEDNRQRFYAEMQYSIDTANAKWRQTVTETNSERLFDAHAIDVKNMFDLNQEGLNRLWDRADSMLDFIFKGTSDEATRDMEILRAEIMAQANSGSDSSGMWGAIGSIGAAVAPILLASDVRLKENINKISTQPNGINVYSWDWNEEGKRVGADKYPTIGVIAQEVLKTHPKAVSKRSDGYLMVNYGKIK